MQSFIDKWTQRAQKNISSLKTKDVDKIKSQIISSQKQMDSSLGSRSGRLAGEIFTSEFRWDRKKSNIDAVKNVTREQLISFSQRVFRREHAVVQWIYGKTSNTAIPEAFYRFTRNRS